MNISYTYLYELINEQTHNVFYIGKTNHPQRRFGGHRTYNNFGDINFYMKIIRKYYDFEDETIKNYINEGHVLLNKRKNDYISPKEYEIGETIKHDPYMMINRIFNN